MSNEADEVAYFNLTNRYVPYRKCNSTNDLSRKKPTYSLYVLTSYLQQLYPFHVRNTLIIRTPVDACIWNDSLLHGLNIIPVIHEYSVEDLEDMNGNDAHDAHVCLFIIYVNYTSYHITIINEHETHLNYLETCIKQINTFSQKPYTLKLVFDTIQEDANDIYCVAYMAYFIEKIMSNYDECSAYEVLYSTGNALMQLTPAARIDMIVDYWNNLYSRIVAAAAAH